MANRFQPISGMIEVNLAWRMGNPKILLEPTNHEPNDNRIVFHETVHYWQQLSQGFLLKMAEEDWNSLKKFENDGIVEDIGAYRLEYSCRDKKVGFSARDLLEALARFWEVQVLGPHRIIEMDFSNPKRHFEEADKTKYFQYKEKGLIVQPTGTTSFAVDLAMRVAGGFNAAPYFYIRERFSPSFTGIVFPLAGHFALQTKCPVEVFLRIIEEVAPIASTLDAMYDGRMLSEAWREYYPIIRDKAIKVSNDLGYGDLMITGVLLENGVLQDHPVYQWILEELLNAQLYFETLVNFGSLDSLRGFDLSFDFTLALLGDKDNRGFITGLLAPPCVRFADGKYWFLSECYGYEMLRTMMNSPYRDSKINWILGGILGKRLHSGRLMEAANLVIEVEKRWQTFLAKTRGYS